MYISLAACHAGFDLVAEVGCVMYHLPASNFSWYAARQICLDLDSHLVEIDSSEKSEALRQHFVESGQYAGENVKSILYPTFT